MDGEREEGVGAGKGLFGDSAEEDEIERVPPPQKKKGKKRKKVIKKTKRKKATKKSAGIVCIYNYM